MDALIPAKTLTLYRTKVTFKLVNLSFKTKNYEKRHYLEIVEYLVNYSSLIINKSL
jgi:hypothetical protein